jgi:hypothetical protein
MSHWLLHTWLPLPSLMLLILQDRGLMHVLRRMYHVTKRHSTKYCFSSDFQLKHRTKQISMHWWQNLVCICF